jgi:hypothetical protein
MNQNTSEGLTREQLLAAIDSEISHFQASNSATGRTRWALTLSLSALLWLGIQIWDNGAFSARNVALLTIALTVLWDFILRVGSSMDSSLLPRQPSQGKFYSFSPLLGALRSTILFYVLKHTAMLAAILWLASSDLVILKWCSIFSLAGAVLGLICSYHDLPPIPALDAPTPFRFVVRLIQRGSWIFHIVAAGSATFAFYQFGARLSAADIRLGIIATAFGYLLTLLVEERFPVSHLAALRTTRQNLAFARLPLAEVRSQVDFLLLAGSSMATAVQHTLDVIFTIAGQVRSQYSQVEGLLPNYRKLSDELAHAPTTGEAVQAKRLEFDRLHKFLAQLYRQATTQHDGLLRRVKTFEGHVEFLALSSASTAKDIEPLVQKLKVTLTPLAVQRDNLKPILSMDRLAVNSKPQLSPATSPIVS